MLTPCGRPADKIEKVMLLNLWCNALQDERAYSTKKFIVAGLGKPTYPTHPETTSAYLSYWRKIAALTKEWHSTSNHDESAAIHYGDPRGDLEAKTKMSQAMSRWYQAQIHPEHILFTIGGLGGLRVIFETLNERYQGLPAYRVLTPFPHYSFYATNPQHRLHPIHVMNQIGYKLTASALESSIKKAYQLAKIDHAWPKAIILCNPSNPLGHIIAEAELIKIAEILRGYPELHIIFDEAYAEMCSSTMPSFLNIAPDLKDRVIILRSATKALSTAGERMAVLLAFDAQLMHEILMKNISFCIHAPRSAQFAYAQTMLHFDDNARQKLSRYYQDKVDYVLDRLRKMGAAMPDPEYKVEATFYALGNFTDLLGLDLPQETQVALQKTGKVSTGEDIAYYLLFKDALMITPLSYFGLSKHCAYMRITCSGSQQELKILMDRLEHRLVEARRNRIIPPSHSLLSQQTLSY